MQPLRILDSILKLGGALAGYVIVSLIAWNRLMQKIMDRLGTIEEWQKTHGRESDVRDGHIHGLQIDMTDQKRISIDIKETLNDIKNSIIRLYDRIDRGG